MKRKVELPIAEPIYSTYHNQGSGGAVCYSNPSIENWYYNQVMLLSCNRKFLSGYTTPEITVADSSWGKNPYIERIKIYTEHMGGYVNIVIRRFLDMGYYLSFSKVDDYYIEHKSWYKQRHFSHDGLICGYDQEDKTYTLYAYDENWIYRKFKVSQASFNRGRASMEKQGSFMNLYAIKPTNEQVELDADGIIEKISDYINCTLDNYPTTEEGNVYGIAVMEYIAMYIDKLIDGSIPYEKTDKRVMRMIWEHKKTMLKRLRRTERALYLSSSASDAYESVVTDSDSIRMLYAAYNLKKRDSLLPVIKNKLLKIKADEEKILSDFLKSVNEKKEN